MTTLNKDKVFTIPFFVTKELLRKDKKEGRGGHVICRYFTSGMNNFEASGFIDIYQVNFIIYTKNIVLVLCLIYYVLTHLFTLKIIFTYLK